WRPMDKVIALRKAQCADMPMKADAANFGSHPVSGAWIADILFPQRIPTQHGRRIAQVRAMLDDRVAFIRRPPQSVGRVTDVCAVRLVGNGSVEFAHCFITLRWISLV